MNDRLLFFSVHWCVCVSTPTLSSTATAIAYIFSVHFVPMKPCSIFNKERFIPQRCCPQWNSFMKSCIETESMAVCLRKDFVIGLLYTTLYKASVLFQSHTLKCSTQGCSLSSAGNRRLDALLKDTLACDRDKVGIKPPMLWRL